MKILKIEVTQTPQNQVRWHVIGRTSNGQIKSVYGSPVAKALGKKALADILKGLADTELAEESVGRSEGNNK